MILTLKTDSPVAKLAIYQGDKEIDRLSWEAGRQLSDQLLERIKGLLVANGSEIHKLDGIILYRGPGSFTGLRIGATVANAMAYALKIPIVGALGDEWEIAGLKRLSAKEDDTQVLPMYGAEPNITKPRK